MRHIRNATFASLAATATMLTLATSATQAAGTWVYLDLIVDGRLDSAVIDYDGDGDYDRVYADTNGDRSYDLVMYDYNLDDYFEWMYARGAGSLQVWIHEWNHAYMDFDGDGRYEAERYDADGDGRFEWQRQDLVGSDGIADTWSRVTQAQDLNTYGSSTMIIGPVTNPDPLYSLIVGLAEETGQVVFGKSDRDHDMWYDDEDAYPDDPYRH